MCDDVLATLFLGRPLDAEARAHLASCPRCGEDAPAVRDVGRALGANPAPLPAAALAGHVLSAAAPLLAANLRRATWRTLGRAVAAALVPLPVVLLLNAYVVLAAHALLATVLPAPLGLWVVGTYTLLLAFLLTLTYGAVPIVVARQLRPASGGLHA